MYKVAEIIIKIIAYVALPVSFVLMALPFVLKDLNLI